MSDTLPPDPAPVAPPSTEPKWIKPVLAFGSLALFGALTAVAIITKNDGAFSMLAGAGISMTTNAVGYYFNSSSGSARKTELAATPTAK